MRYNSSFALGYLLVEMVGFVVALIRGAIELVFALLDFVFRQLVHTADHSRRDEFAQALKMTAEPYMAVLVAKRTKLLRADEYGLLHVEPWARELNHFVQEALIPNLGENGAYVRRNLRDVANMLDDMIAARQPVPDTGRPVMRTQSAHPA